MTATRYDRAPGDTSRSADLRREALSSVFVYTIGVFLAAILTATSFWVANTPLLWPPGVPLGLGKEVLWQQLVVEQVGQRAGPPRVEGFPMAAGEQRRAEVIQ